MSTDSQPTAAPPVHRRIFCNRTLNLRSNVKAIGYDMDYTLVDYRVAAFEQMVYDQARERLASEGWPVDALAFDPRMVTRGLIVDTELGNLVKANRFGFVKKACHGTRPLDFESEPRYKIVFDCLDASQAGMSKSFYIFTADLNDGPSVMLSNDVIPENSPAGSRIGYLTVVGASQPFQGSCALSDSAGGRFLLDNWALDEVTRHVEEEADVLRPGSCSCTSRGRRSP